jgi:hypothetical protein
MTAFLTAQKIDIKNAVKIRKIDYIFHFTRLENLDKILSNGIIPRATLEVNEVVVAYNDDYRYDGCRDASCFSIGFPNYKMFYRLRMDNPEKEWIVIACASNVLWAKDCAFCYENAASGNVTLIPLQNRKGVQAFEKLFTPAHRKPSRDKLGLPDNYPTNPQAEVLIFDIIEPEYIGGIVCRREITEKELKRKHPDFEFVNNTAFFDPRIDYEHWR